MVLDVKPLAGQIFVRVREFRDGEEFIDTIGPNGSPIIAEVRKLAACRLSMICTTAPGSPPSIVVAATGCWTRVQRGYSYNRDDEPASWKNEAILDQATGTCVST